MSRRFVSATALTKIPALVLIMALMGVALFAPGIARIVPTYAATLVVTSNADTNTIGTLRYAMNNTLSGDTITFNLTPPNNIITLISALPQITKNLTIDGSNAGNQVVVDGANQYQIFSIASGVTATLQNLTIQNGNSGSNGGGVDNDGTLTISSSTISGNSASINGGGVYNAGILTMSSSTLSGNSAVGGGGVYNIGTLTISNSTISGNSATNGGGVDNGGTLTISSSTISDNSATNGGGVDNAGTVNLFSSIVAKQTNGGDIGGTVTSRGYNIVGDGSGGVTNGVNQDQVGTIGTPLDPGLGPLQYNGGLTQTQAITTSSIAYGKGNCAGNSTVTPVAPAVIADQRTVTRKNTGSGLGCDVGAYEVQPSPAPLAVNSTSDDPIACGAIGVYCLRNEIAVANSFGASFTPSAVPASQSAVNITFLPAGQGTITLSGLELLLTGNSNQITIDGAGKVTFDGNHQSRVFEIAAGSTVTLNTLTIQNGQPDVEEYGGGVSNSGTLTINNSVISGNSTSGFGVGGGVYSIGTLTITSSILSGNSAYNGGGVINYGLATISSSTISGNSASYNGGGVYNFGNPNRNSPLKAILTISNSTVFNNSADVDGGGVYNRRKAMLTISNSTVSGNSAIFDGGGVANADPDPTHLNLFSTIVANQVPGGGVDIAGFNVNTLGYNIVGDGTGGVTNGVNHDQTGTANLNLAAALSGSAPQTLAFTLSSIAYGNGSCGGNSSINPPAPAVTTGENGVARKPSCDVGAFEFTGAVGTATSPGGPSSVVVADPLIVKSADLSLAQPGEVVHFTLTVTNPGGLPAQGVIVTDPLDALFTPQSATASQGTFNIRGQTVTFTVGTVNPGQTVNLTVTAVISKSAKPPTDVNNTATLIDGQGHKSASTATIHITAGKLPSTGEHPDNGLPLWSISAAGIVVIGAAGVTMIRRRTR